MKKFCFKKVIVMSVVALFLAQALYMFAFEPTILSATDDSDDVIVTLNVEAGLTLSDGANVTMSPPIGISANSSIGGSYWIATTNNESGYTLAVKASTSPALKSGTNSFADYTTTVTDTPETWSADSGTYQFGYSVNGNDVSTSTWGTATTCGSSGVPDTSGKYRGFTTSDINVASTSTVTPFTGTQTNICFAAEQNGVFAPSGSYTATITATMTAS